MTRAKYYLPFALVALFEICIISKSFWQGISIHNLLEKVTCFKVLSLSNIFSIYHTNLDIIGRNAISTNSNSRNLEIKQLPITPLH